MIIVSAFTEDGVPKTGLSPTIRIRKLSDNSLVVTDEAMAEVGDGFYKFDFTTYNADNDYAIRTDGSNELEDFERYQFTNDETKSDTIIANDKFNKASAKIEDNVLTVYDDEGDIKEWDLKDSSGSPASINVYQREAK